MLNAFKVWVTLVRDDRRVRRRFVRVEQMLRARDVSQLPQAIQQIRFGMLDQLRSYYRHGIFPRNYDYPGHRPSFIDREGRLCAVAYLMVHSGQGDLARRISLEMNDAYVRQLDLPEVGLWAAQTGLSTDELALIQPSYQCTFDPATYPYVLYHLNGVFYGLMTLLHAAGAFSLMAAALNGWVIFRQQRNRAPLILGILAGVFLIVSTLLHYTTALAYSTPIRQYFDVLGTYTDPISSSSWRPCLNLPIKLAVMGQFIESVPRSPVTFYLPLLILGILLSGFCLVRWWRLSRTVQSAAVLLEASQP